MGYQILLIDDDATFREELKECLEGYEVVEASNGQQALEILKKPNAIDVVLLDVVMSGLSGIDVLREIKILNPKLSTVIITGKSSKDIAIEALKGHADDYLEKPFDVEKLIKTIEKVIAIQHRGSADKSQGIQAKMEQAKFFIERNYDKRVTLTDVANQVYLSPKYFSRVFKQIIGMTFNEYRLKIKTMHAAQLLKKTECTVNELSNQLGYKNTESFIRTFKDFMKCTPTEYRHKHKK